MIFGAFCHQIGLRSVANYLSSEGILPLGTIKGGEKNMSSEFDEILAPGHKIIRNGKIIPDDGGPSDVPGYFDEQGRFIQPEDFDAE